jgi:hypothetical protein
MVACFTETPSSIGERLALSTPVSAGAGRTAHPGDVD